LNALLDTALSLYDKDSGFADGVRHMLSANVGIEHVSRLKDSAVFNASISIPHFDSAVQHSENLFAVIDMPIVWFICPMKARSDAAHVGNVCGAPRTLCSICATAKYFHGVPNEGKKSLPHMMPRVNTGGKP
jgi:hypothetical protein